MAAIALLAVLGSAQLARAATSAGGMYWGASIGAQFSAQDSAAAWGSTGITGFSHTDAGGKQLSVVNTYWNLAGRSVCGAAGCGFSTVEPALNTIVNYGAIPMLSWATDDADDTSANGYSDQNIAAGSQDTTIARFASAVAAWKNPIFLRLDWEMNGNWVPWGVGSRQYDNSAASYRAMWQRIYTIFQRQGATNATFVWCPNEIDSDDYGPSHRGTPTLNSLYPGDADVGWTCMDGYNGPGEDPSWESFAQVFQYGYQALTTGVIAGGTSYPAVAPDKPIIIGETATSERDAPAQTGKAQWISNMFASLPYTFPQIHGLLWFDAVSRCSASDDWAIECSPTRGAAGRYESAFSTGVAIPDYISNVSPLLAAGSSPAPPLSTPAPVAPPAEVWNDSNDQWLFTVNASAGTIDERYDNGSSWSTASLGGEPVAAGTRLSAISGPAVYYTGANGKVWSWSYNGSAWTNIQYSSWQSVQTGSSPSAIISGTNTYVFWPDPAGTVDESVANSAGAWTTTSASLGGESVAPYAGLAVTAAHGATPGLDYTGADQQIWQLSPSGSTWNNYDDGASWEPVADGTTPVVISDSSSYNAWVYWIGADGQVYTSVWNASADAWTAQSQSLAGQTAAPATTLGVFPDINSTPTLFYEGLNGQIWSYDPTGSGFDNYSQPTWQSGAQGSAPTAVYPDGATQVYWIGSNGDVYQADYTSSGWSTSSLGTA
jgi:hypothetical protein